MSVIGIKDTQHRFGDVAKEPCIMMTPIEGFNKKRLGTLEDAAKPLENIVPRIDTYVHVAKQRAENPPDNLSVDESAAIALYTMEWHPYTESLYHILNMALRTEDRQQLIPWFLYLKLLFTALSRLPSETLTVYRGVRCEIVGVNEKYQQGKQVVWWGFSSCSTSQSVSKKEQFLGETGRRTLFVIQCRKGKNIGQHSYYKKEHEILLLPATKVEVVKYDTQDDGLHTIYLKEIESSFVLLEPVSSDDEIRALKNTAVVKTNLRETRPSILELERHFNAQLHGIIALCKPRGEAYLIGKRFNEYDIELIVEKLIIEKQCRELFLRESQVTSQGAIVISQALRTNKTLARLFISHNRIGDIGAKALADALSDNNNIHLKELCLGDNGITDNGVEHLAAMLESNKTLTHLWLPTNQITDRGLQRLIGILMNSNKTLLELSLEWNRFVEDSSVKLLSDLLKQNQTLTKLNLESCKMPKKAFKELKSIAKTKKNFSLIIH